jgi:small nuclear ribonucleoprotein (snRNP)-like protein
MEQLLRNQIKRKQKLIRIILTDGTEIRGKVHLLPDYRLLDLLNNCASSKRFLALTEVWVKLPHGEEVHLPFTAVNVNVIRLCFPL